MTSALSPAQRIARAGKSERLIQSLTIKEAALLPFEWSFWARPAQLEPPGDWFICLWQCGRGWGKNRTAVEAVRMRIDSGSWRTVNVAGPTWTDVMDVMVQGSAESPGLLKVWPPHREPTLRMAGDDPHLRCWNGAKIRLRAAHSSERFRGTQADGAWIDEIDSWKPDQFTAEEALQSFLMTIRTGRDPRVFATATPKRGGLVAKLVKRDDVMVIRGSTYDNRANLANAYFKSVIGPLDGTRLGRQEIMGEILPDVDGAFITHEMIDRRRVVTAPLLIRRVVAIDPAVSIGENADETGIIAAGKCESGHGYVTHDRSFVGTPLAWARRAVDLYHETEANLIVAEKNNGGLMVENTIRQIDRNVPIKLVNASKAKHVRAEPIALRYERGEVHHVGSFPKLEDQLTGFTAEGYMGDESPDRGDAAVWALTELLVQQVATWKDLYPERAA